MEVSSSVCKYRHDASLLISVCHCDQIMDVKYCVENVRSMKKEGEEGGRGWGKCQYSQMITLFLFTCIPLPFHMYSFTFSHVSL